MKKILILMGRYLPGHKDGGPLRTIVNLTDALGDEYDFRIAALDRDHGDTQAYPDIQTNQWNSVGKAKVWYVPPKGFTFRFLQKMIQECDLVYTCGFYNDYGYKTLLLKRFGLLKDTPVIVAPMGTFSKGALQQKALKKTVFIRLLCLLRMFADVTWSVTSDREAEELKQCIGTKARCVVAEDLPRTKITGDGREKTQYSRLKVVFLSRISPKKNLKGAIEILKQVHAEVDFTICGPQSDAAYWADCKSLCETLPAHIRWCYKGDIPSEQVPDIFLQQDVFLFPTLGENYGHVIFEALSAGCIPIISDRTPWESIKDRDAGYVLPLERMQDFAEAVDHIAQMGELTRWAMRQRAVQIAKDKVAESQKHTGYRTVFG